VLKLQIILFCLLAYLISWGSKFFISAHDAGWIGDEIPIGVFQLLSQFGPSLAGVIMIAAIERRKGIIIMLKNLSCFKIRYKWYLFALFFELILFLIIVLASSSYGVLTLNASVHFWFNSLKNFLLNTFYLTLLTGLGEEIGWRGFLLPRLQSRLPVLICSIIAALIASFWHLRTADLTLLLQGNLEAFRTSFFPDMGLRILISAPVLFVIVYLFNKTKGSLVIMILLHGASNASYEWVKEITGMNDPSFTLPWFALSLWLISVFFIIALIRMEKKKEIITNLSSIY
jgi:membrane protease YdiL (CAAX protease family)